MKLKLVDVNSTELSLYSGGNAPQPWMLDMAPVSRRSNYSNRYGRPGGVNVSDKSENIRKAVLRTDVTAESDSDHIGFMQTVLAFFNEERAPVYIEDTDTSRKLLVELESVDLRPYPGNEKRAEALKINLVCPDVAWENTVNSGQNSILSDGQTFADVAVDLVNAGQLDLFPIIEVTPAANNQEFSIYNLTTGNKITIASPLIPALSVVTIDCINGTVSVNDGVYVTEINNSIVDGTGFLFCTPGVNIIRYNSIYGDAQINFKIYTRFYY